MLDLYNKLSLPTDVPLFYSKNPTDVPFKGGFIPTATIPIQKLRIKKNHVPVQRWILVLSFNFCNLLGILFTVFLSFISNLFYFHKITCGKNSPQGNIFWVSYKNMNERPSHWKCSAYVSGWRLRAGDQNPLI